MLRKESEAVPEGNGPVPQKKKNGSGQPTRRDVYRMMKEAFDLWDKRLDEISDKVEEYIEEQRNIDQRWTRLEYGARQPRLAMMADGPAHTKTRERMEGAATAVQAMHGVSFSARRVEPGPNTNLTSFGVKAEPPDLPCMEDVLIEDGATSPESCLPSLEVRSSTAAGGLVPNGKTSTATDTTVNKPLLQSYSSEEKNSKKKNLRTSTPCVSYDSSAFQESNLPAAPYCRRAVETKSRQNRTFYPGGLQGHLRACPF